MIELYLSVFALFVCSGFVSGQICWDTKWYNESLTLKNGSSYEHQSVAVLAKICTDGSSVIAAHCKDEKGETFTIRKNDTINHYIAVCDFVKGLICHPYKSAPNATCPDFAIQYGCRCPSTAHAKGAGTPRSGGTTFVTVSKKTGEGRTGNNTGSGNGRKSANSARRNNCRNSAHSFGNIVFLLALSTFVLILLNM